MKNCQGKFWFHMYTARSHNACPFGQKNVFTMRAKPMQLFIEILCFNNSFTYSCTCKTRQENTSNETKFVMTYRKKQMIDKEFQLCAFLRLSDVPRFKFGCHPLGFGYLTREVKPIRFENCRFLE